MFALEAPTEWVCPITGYAIPKGLDDNLRHREDVLLACVRSDDVRNEYMDMCKASCILWINLFVWTFNVKAVDAAGREKPAEIQHVPFITWPVQDAALTELQAAIDAGDDALIDKSRDMGASWLNITVADWYWLFKPDSLVLLTSRVEDLVDKSGDPDSLFWKIDYINRNLPDWMLPGHPDDFQRGGKHRSHMHLGRPDNASSIDGQATTEHIGRGGRRKFILFDEMAAMDNAAGAWRSAADSTACRVANSTPIGPGTEFSRLRNAGVVAGVPKVVTLGYWDHPQKGQGREWRVDEDGSVTGLAGRGYWWTPWFEREVKRRDQMDVAQNILIDHTTSGGLFFNSTIVTRHIQQYASEPIRGEISEGKFSPMDNGRWFIWFKPNEQGKAPVNDNYVIFADPSYGKGAANSTAAVMSRETGKIIAEYADPYTSPDDLSKELQHVGTTVFAGQFGQAFIGWEVNGPGEAMYRDFDNYAMTYYQREVGKRTERRSREYGWRSDDKKKRILCGALSTALARGEVQIPSKPGLMEMLEYVFYDNGSIGPGLLRDELTGARAAHGDRVIAYAGCVFLRLEAPHFEPEKPKIEPWSMADVLGHKNVFERMKRHA